MVLEATFPDAQHQENQRTRGNLAEEPHIDIPTADCMRWQLAYQNWNYDTDSALLATRIRNFPRFTGIRKQWPLYVGLALAGFIYGGLHCLAWNAPFPSGLEATLWRISSVTITSTGALVAMVVPWDLLPPLWKRNFNFLKDVGDLEDKIFDFLGLGGVYDWFDDLADRHPEIPWVIAQTTRFMGFGGIIVVFGVLCAIKCVLDLGVALFIVLYVLARVYLVVECFINLAHLPESAYGLPKWSQYVPHIG